MYIKFILSINVFYNILSHDLAFSIKAKTT